MSIVVLLLAVAAGPTTVDTAAIDRAFDACASAYRRSISGNDDVARPFDCAEKAASAGGDDTTTYGMVMSYGAAANAGLRWLAALDREAVAKHALSGAVLARLTADVTAYRMTLCSIYGGLHGGTIDRSNAAMCGAQQVDVAIGDRLVLLKEAGVIPNGR